MKMPWPISRARYEEGAHRRLLRLRQSATALFLSGVFLIAYGQKAYAYLDIGTSNMVFQFAVSALITVLLFIRKIFAAVMAIATGKCRGEILSTALAATIDETNDVVRVAESLEETNRGCPS